VTRGATSDPCSAPSLIDARAMRRSAGFTVIELVLAAIATLIVAAVIVSAFRTHFVRAQVASGVQLASPWRSMVELRFRDSGTVPRTWADLKAASANISSIYVETVEVEHGRIDIIFGDGAASPIAGRRVSLTPYETADQEIVWICGNGVPGPGLEPLGFASGGPQPTQIAATVAPRYLPPVCR
jgi:Tfp pilus assembly major pilin PilA